MFKWYRLAISLHIIFTVTTLITFLFFVYKQDLRSQAVDGLFLKVEELEVLLHATNTELEKATKSFNNLKIKSLQILCPKAYSKNLTLLPDGEFYYLGDEEFNWTRSKAFCDENDMELVNIKSENEITMLWAVAKEISLDWWWVSASNVGRPGGQYAWSDGRELPNNSSWWDKENNQPDSVQSKKEFCVDFRDGKLYDYKCDKDLHFICKVKSKCM
ncbi:lectin-like [Neocloeon triangulifer]|uniref:lectin-like n=1 Tax=Neocloeon triangulifer TaxID=2078957 RepID=UPI00286EF466|nr:lectin-like [Neocloeon triangulifer]